MGPAAVGTPIWGSSDLVPGKLQSRWVDGTATHSEGLMQATRPDRVFLIQKLVSSSVLLTFSAPAGFDWLPEVWPALFEGRDAEESGTKSWLRWWWRGVPTGAGGKRSPAFSSPSGLWGKEELEEHGGLQAGTPLASTQACGPQSLQVLFGF